MSFFNRSARVDPIILDSFRQNYIQTDPLDYFYDRLTNHQKFTDIETGTSFMFGPFKCGEKLKKVQGRIQTLHTERIALSPDCMVDILLSIDRIENIRRVSVFYFMNKTLFGLKYYFPFIASEEIDFLLKLIMEKYVPEMPDNASYFTRIKGANDIYIFLDQFVSVSYEFLHASPENQRILTDLYKARSEKHNLSDKCKKTQLLSEL